MQNTKIYHTIVQYTDIQVFTTNQFDFVLFAVSQPSSGPGQIFFSFLKRDCHERDLRYLGLGVLFLCCFNFMQQRTPQAILHLGCASGIQELLLCKPIAGLGPSLEESQPLRQDVLGCWLGILVQITSSME